MGELKLQNVTKSFAVDGGSREVLSDINLTIREGEFVAIVGFSGVGKTTLISLLAGLLMPDSGTIAHNGHPIRGPGRERAVVFQSYALLPWLSALENVELAIGSAFPELSKPERVACAEAHLALVNLSAARDKRVRELSGGMRQRVAIARALSLAPDVLLLDEPLGALDALTRSTLQREFEALLLREQKTMVMITNDVEEAVLLADRVIPLSMGPRATLGPAFEVTLPRPRDKKRLAHDPDAKRVRIAVTEYLVRQMREKGALRRAEEAKP